MKESFKKVKTEHTILSEFLPFLTKLEQEPGIQRMIPGRIARQQKGSSALRFSISTQTPTGRKAKMSKGATSQELFIITEKTSGIDKSDLEQLWTTFTSTQ
ncbi:hypothetical protein BSK20_01475 [SR1 bacterium human oral taxon HOT-345]|nr:hypothetical protein BSK20_01475 [SR1 bacterium human oral taxon HOT-345]